MHSFVTFLVQARKVRNINRKLNINLSLDNNTKGRHSDVPSVYSKSIFIIIYLMSFFLIVKIEITPVTIIYAAATPRPISLSLFSPKQLT